MIVIPVPLKIVKNQLIIRILLYKYSRDGAGRFFFALLALIEDKRKDIYLEKTTQDFQVITK